MKKIFYTLFLIVSISLLSGCKKEAKQTIDVVTGIEAIKKKKEFNRELAIIQAGNVFKQAQIDGLDLSTGPCLSNNLIEDWVLDIIHDPREVVDDQDSNQCPAYNDGRAHHLIEMDLNGRVIHIR